MGPADNQYKANLVLDEVGVTENHDVWKAETNELACNFTQCVFREGACVCMYVYMYTHV